MKDKIEIDGTTYVRDGLQTSPGPWKLFVVDNGWIPYAHQIGQTGTTVRPSLYIAIGISGAVQHIAGMVDSKKIIAINNDPNAPIFKVANYKILGDLNEVIPMMIDAIKEKV